MAILNKFNSFTYELGKGTHNFTSHTLKAVFTNTEPLATNAVLADIVEIPATGGYPVGGIQLDNPTWTTKGGVAKLVLDDKVFLATDTVGPFRYVVIYNDTPEGDPLIGWYDYGQSIILKTDESLTIDFNQTSGVLTIT